MGSKTFNFTGQWEKWDVPAGVKVVNVELSGAGSGGRAGGKVIGDIRVDGTDVLWIMVGEAGRDRTGTSGRQGGGTGFGGGGGGGDGTNAGQGGRGGGGASAIRMNAKDGPLRAVAGGAGGNSGDGGLGGLGGPDIGAYGARGSSGTGETADATGGTQNQKGLGGTSSVGQGYWGHDAEPGHLGRGGRGAGPAKTSVHGGGGGGGGYFAGGGGQAGSIGVAPGGGGGGGSNYDGGMFGSVSQRGTGGTGNGQAVLTWDTTAPPTPPTDITIDGHNISDGLATKATSSVTVRGTPDDPDAVRGVRMFIWMSRFADFRTYSKHRGTYDPVEHRDKVELTGLSQDTRYYLRLYTQDINGNFSTSYRTTNFWTNRRPDLPTLIAPAENAQFSAISNVTFQWNHNDPDPSDPQQKWELRWRKMATPVEDAGPWHSLGIKTGSVESWVIDAGTFAGNNFYEWQVRTQDQQNRWSEWAIARSFFVTATTTPPIPLYPINNEAVVAATDTTFRWQFKSPMSGATQSRADLRYRVFGSTDADWVTLIGTVVTPGAEHLWSVPAETFGEHVHYEWQVRSVSNALLVSDWSVSQFFWGTANPGTGAGVDVIASGQPDGPLGQGDNRVFVFDRGGTLMRGEITPLTDVKWARKRDDIATFIIHIHQWDEDMKAFLGSLRSWVHELVIFRDGERVAEGPISRIAWTRSSVEIEAKDVMNYPYRRVLRQGFNDSYRIIDGNQTGLSTVVERASQIIMNALAYDDPNVLPYLTIMANTGDARTSRVRKDWVITAWEEVDDLAAKGGLDYTTAGRRIILWDTHRPLGRLPEMREGDFSDEVIITEYGMSLANVFGVTNNDGLYGVATRGLDADGNPGPEGFVEQLASSYGETEGSGTERTLTREALKRAIEALTEQAKRNITDRWQDYGPSPLVVRVPDNTTLSPTLNIGINQLVPGVWIPVRCNTGIREVAQWQKLDSIEVFQDKNGEKINVVMSPAPNGGQDPDADEAATEE